MKLNSFSDGEGYVVDDSERDNPRMWTVSHYIDNDMMIGEMLVTFDKETVYNLFTDFPEKFTHEQIQILKEENPFWYNFFASRLTQTEENFS